VQRHRIARGAAPEPESFADGGTGGAWVASIELDDVDAAPEP
jgi:hypothetical protein